MYPDRRRGTKNGPRHPPGEIAMLGAHNNFVENVITYYNATSWINI